MVEQGLVTQQRGLKVLEMSPAQLDIVRNQICAGASLPEIEFFIQFCMANRLSPFRRQVYAVMRKTNDVARMVIQIGIDGYRLLARRSGGYLGSDAPEFGPENDKGYPEWARVRVNTFIDGQAGYTVGEARWREFYPGDQQGSMWRKMPYNQLAKCAEAQALRKSGLLNDEDLPMDKVEFTSDEIPAVIMTPGGTVARTDTGEVIRVSAREVTPAAKLHQEQLAEVLRFCPFHEKDWFTTEKMRQHAHPTDAKNEQGGTVLCNRSTVLNRMLDQEASAYGVSVAAFTEHLEKMYEVKAKSRLSDEQKAEVILWVREQGEAEEAAPTDDGTEPTSISDENAQPPETV